MFKVEVSEIQEVLVDNRTGIESFHEMCRRTRVDSLPACHSSYIQSKRLIQT